MNRIAQAFIELSTKGADKVRATLKGVSADARKVNQDASGIKDGFTKGLGAAEKFQSLVGKLLIPVAVAGSIAGIAEKFRALVSEARKFRREIEAIGKASDQINRSLADQVRETDDTTRLAADLKKQYDDQLAALKAQRDVLAEDGNLLQSLQRGITALFTDEPVLLREKLLQLEKEEVAVNEKFNESRRQLTILNREIASQSAEQADKQNEALQIDLLRRRAAVESNGAAKAELERQALELEQSRELRDIDEQIAKQRAKGIENDPFVAALLRRRQLIVENGNIELRQIAKVAQAEADAKAKQDEDDQKAARETARIIAEANTQAAAQTRQALLDAVSAINSQGPAFSQIEDLVASIADSVRELKGRI